MYFAMDSRKIPMVRLVNETVIDPPYVHRRRIPHEWIIYLVKNGRMEPEEDGILYHLSPGDFLLLDPEGRHEGREATHCEYSIFIFSIWISARPGRMGSCCARGCTSCAVTVWEML